MKLFSLVAVLFSFGAITLFAGAFAQARTDSQIFEMQYGCQQALMERFESIPQEMLESCLQIDNSNSYQAVMAVLGSRGKMPVRIEATTFLSIARIQTPAQRDCVLQMIDRLVSWSGRELEDTCGLEVFTGI